MPWQRRHADLWQHSETATEGLGARNVSERRRRKLEVPAREIWRCGLILDPFRHAKYVRHSFKAKAGKDERWLYLAMSVVMPTAPSAGGIAVVTRGSSLTTAAASAVSAHIVAPRAPTSNVPVARS